MVGKIADCRVDCIESMVGGLVAVGFVKSLVPGLIALLAVGLLERVAFLVSDCLAAWGVARPCLQSKPRFT